MNTWFKRVARVLVVLAVVLVAAIAFSPKANAANKGWTYQDGAYYYYNDNGTMRKNNWAEYNGTWYYLGSNGKLAYNTWVSYAGAYYYLGKDGKVVVNDWVKYAGKYYYMGANGKPLINDSIVVGGTYYYFGSDASCTMSRPASLDSAITYQYEWHSGDYSYQYVVPKLGITSAYASTVNAALAKLATYAKDQAAAVQNGADPEAVYIDYEVRYYKGNLTIDVFIEFNNNSWRQDYVFNINTATGKENTTDHMLQLKGMSKQTYNTVLKQQVAGWWKYFFPESIRQYNPDGYDRARSNTLSAENLSNATLRIDAGGSLYACVKFYQMAGASYTCQWVFLSD